MSSACGSHVTRFTEPRIPLLPAGRQHATLPARRSRQSLHTRAAASFFSQFPREQLIAAGSVAAVALGSVVGGIAWFQQQQQQDGGPSPLAQEDMSPAPPQSRRDDAVLVIGTGKTGRLVTAELAKAGRCVVAASRSGEAAQAVAQNAGGDVSFEGSVDVTNPASLADHVFQGVSQVVVAVAPSYQDSGSGNSSEKVDAAGTKNVVEACKRHFPQQERLQRTQVVSLESDQDVSRFERLDDVIMGGQSESHLTVGPEGTAVWKGVLRVEGGGFCGCRSQGLQLDLSQYDGLCLQVLGDGQSFKVNLKTADQDHAPECTYQASFDTVEGEWATVDLPWRQFVAVNRGRVDQSAPPLNPRHITQLGLVLSRFLFNDLPNSQYRPGEFTLQIRNGFEAFKAPRPRLVLVSSAGVERNALIGDDEAARKKEIPIVQLNPGGVLNHKYAGENAVRQSGLPYTVIRPTGLSDDKELGPGALEYSQGDTISGKVLRSEVAAVVAAALGTPASVGKTLELRRSEEGDAGRRVPSWQQLQHQFLPLAEDRHRPRLGIPPLPKAVPPPPPPSKERLEEILADPRVQSAAQRNRAANGQPGASSNTNGAGMSQNGNSQGSNGKLENSVEAKEWIGDWRSRTGATVNN